MCRNKNMSKFGERGGNSMFVRFLKKFFVKNDNDNKKEMWKIGKVVFPHQCPVCKKYDFIEPFEDCPICSWCNDVVQEEHPDWTGCANNMSLNMALEAYSKGERVH